MRILKKILLGDPGNTPEPGRVTHVVRPVK